MYILGLTCYGHDSSAAIIKDGELITAVEEERFNRVKHSHVFPIHSLNYCLKEAGITFDQIDHVGYYLRPWLGYLPMFTHFFKYLPRSLNLIYDRHVAKNQDDYIPYGPLTDPLAILNVGKKVRTTFEAHQPRFKFHFLEHHLCHQASSVPISPFEEAACLSVDGCGEWCTTMTAFGQGNRIKEGKNTLRWDKTSCHRFEANQARLLMGVIAYNLLHMLRSFYVIGEEVRRSIEWIIKRLVKVGAKVVYHSRRWHVHAASAFPLVRHYEAVFG